MNKILEKRELVKDIHEMIVDAPLVASKAQAGHFVLVMADEVGERIPLTIADHDRDRGTITLIFMVVGTSSGWGRRRSASAAPKGRRRRSTSLRLWVATT